MQQHEILQYQTLNVSYFYRAPTTFKLEGEMTSLSESSQGEVICDKSKHSFVTPLKLPCPNLVNTCS